MDNILPGSFDTTSADGMNHIWFWVSFWPHHKRYSKNAEWSHLSIASAAYQGVVTTEPEYEKASADLDTYNEHLWPAAN